MQCLEKDDISQIQPTALKLKSNEKWKKLTAIYLFNVYNLIKYFTKYKFNKNENDALIETRKVIT